MKKTLSLILALLLVAVLATGAMAATGENWGNGNNGKKITMQKKLPPGQQKVKQKNQKQIEKAIKQVVKEQYREHSKVKPQTVKAKRFNDTYQHWAAECIEEMAGCQLLKGYPDGTFKPDQRLTQAEALSLIMRIAAVTVDEDEELDEDQSKLAELPAWVRGDANKAAKKGIIKLNRFHSHVQASRAQTAVMIAKALGLEPVDTSNIPFKDGILLSSEDVGYILALYQEGIISGSPNGNFNPNSAITRAEMASILQRLLDKGEIISVTLPKTATVEQGESITLKATVKYSDGSTDNSVAWSSSNTALATVKDGVVTAAKDKTGTVTITAIATRGESTMSATCKVTVVEEVEIIAADLEATGKVGSHDGKVYQEYALEVDGEKISLAVDDVKSITLKKDGAKAVELTPNTDSTFWFNVQRASGEYTLKVIDEDDNSYEATLDWVAPIQVAAIATGNSGEHDGNHYVEFRLGDIDLSRFTCMYQIKPNGDVVKLTANRDSNLWFKTNGQVGGKHIFLIKKNNVWYSSSISI